MSATNNNHGYETSLQGTIAQHQIEDAAAYESIASERASSLFRGLCASFRVSDRCFQALLDDGWDHPDQFRDLTSEWREHILALAPNGGQKKNVEKLLDRVQAGLVSGPAANDRRVDADASTHLEGNTAGSSGNVGRDSVDVIEPSSGPPSTKTGAASIEGYQAGRRTWKGILWTGIAQVILGCLMAILGGVTIAAVDYGLRQNVGTPIWCGLPLIAFAGFFGIMSGCKKSHGIMKYESEQRLVVSGHPQNVAAHNTHAATGQAQSASSAQQGQLPQTRAPPTGEQQYQELIR